MRGHRKTKDQLIDELAQMRQRIAELEKAEAERKRAEEALEESEAKYRSLIENSPDGIAIVHGLEVRFVNRVLLEMFGCHSEDEMVGHEFTEFVAPEFRNLMRERGRAREMGEHAPSRYEFKALRKDGTQFDAEISVSAIRYQGSVARQGIIRDVTERRRAEEALRSSETKCRTLVETAIVGMVATREGKVVFCNKKESEIFGYENPSDLCGRSITEFVHEDDLPRLIEVGGEIRLGQAMASPATFRGIRSDAREVVIEALAMQFPFEGEDTILSFHVDITERKRAEEELRESARRIRELSITDELTGLYNRRHFYEVLETEMYRVQRYGHSLSVVTLDIDGFKEYNDTFGHTSGDAVLKSFAQTLTSALRKTDTAFRYGGDEFTMILPLTGAERARKIADRIRSKWLQAPKAEKLVLKTPLGLSAGVAEYPENAETADGLAFLADTALYRSKREGGNKSTLVSDLGALRPDVVDRATLDQVYALSARVEAKDPYTYGHSKRVAAISEIMGKAIGLSRKRLADLNAAGLLHDIGKVGVSDSILIKPDKPTEDEWKLIRKHCAEGAKIVGFVRELTALVPMIRHHHEWYDGTGYPDGLKGEDIPVAARILAIADAYDTMTTARTYRHVVSQGEALEELKRCSRTQFDPELVEAFYQAMDEAARQD